MGNDKKIVLEEKKAELAGMQQLIKEHNFPVIVLIEGWGAAGKGTLLGRLIRDMDPRFYRVIPGKTPTDEDRRMPFIWRYFKDIPENGKFLFMDSGWMEEIVAARVSGEIDKDTFDRRVESIKIFERQLVDNGYVLVKLFLDIDRNEQQKRVEKLLSDKDTKWRVSDSDKLQLKKREKFEKYYKKCMDATDLAQAPWNIMLGTDEKTCAMKAFSLITDAIRKRIDSPVVPEIQDCSKFNLKKMPSLSEVDLDKKLTREEYDKELEKCRKKLRELHNKLYRAKIPVVIAYEGWDAAGKGGNIKRLTSGLDARGFEVNPIASPLPPEKARHYLWRFFTRLPKSGHIAIFDRTWYGRVMVERLEGFCSENDWKRAYGEINEFEKELVDSGAIVIKFWIQIDKDTQLERFTERQNNPEKQWKLTDEDWRNREKWDVYEDAVNEMIQKTSTKIAPWYIVESNDKLYARIKVMKTVIETIEKALSNEK